MTILRKKGGDYAFLDHGNKQNEKKKKKKNRSIEKRKNLFKASNSVIYKNTILMKT